MTKKNYYISIALATYNGARYISDLLDSLLKQTRTPDEIIVVDDMSTDGTIEILNAYALKFSLIKVFQNKTNLGVNRNFEKAISLCKGDYIFICDQDDIWLSNNIEKKIETILKMPHDEPNLVVGHTSTVNQQLQKMFSVVPSKDSQDPYEIWPNSYQGTTMCFNKNLWYYLKNWPKNFKEYPYDCYIKNIAFLYGNIYAISNPLILYRIHNGNTSSPSTKYRGNKWNLFRRYCLTVAHLKQIQTTIQNPNNTNLKESRFNAIKYLTNNVLKANKLKLINILGAPSFSISQKIRLMLSSAIYQLRNKAR